MTGTGTAGTVASVGAVGTVLVARARAPRVDLLPPEFAELDRVQTIRVAAAGGVLAAAALVGLVAVAAAGAAADGRAELAAAQAARLATQQEVTALLPVRQVQAEMDAAEARVAAATSTEISWSTYLDDLSHTVPAGVWIETLAVTPPAAPAPTAPAPTAPGLAGTPGALAATHGSITFTGRGRSHDDVAAWLEALAGQPGLVDATFTTSVRDEAASVPTVTFTSSVTLGPESLAHRTES